MTIPVTPHAVYILSAYSVSIAALLAVYVMIFLRSRDRGGDDRP